MLPEERIVMVLVFVLSPKDSIVIVPDAETVPERRANTTSTGPPKLIVLILTSVEKVYISLEEAIGL